MDIEIERLPETTGAAFGAAALAAEGAGIASAVSMTGNLTGETIEPSEADVAAYRVIHDAGWAVALSASYSASAAERP